MWQHYKKTFFGMQVTILIVTAAVYRYLGQNWVMTLSMFVTMQLGTVVGALWGSRLSRKIQGSPSALPLRPKA